MNANSHTMDLKYNIRALRRMARRQALVLAVLTSIGTGGYLVTGTNGDDAVAVVDKQADARQQPGTAPQSVPEDRQSIVAAVAPYPDAAASPQPPSVPGMGTQSPPMSGGETHSKAQSAREPKVPRSVAKAEISASARPVASPSETSKPTAPASEPRPQLAPAGVAEAAVEHQSGTPTQDSTKQAVVSAKSEPAQVQPVAPIVRDEPPVAGPVRQISDISSHSKPKVTSPPELTPLQKIVSSQDRALQSLNTIPSRQ